MLSRNAVWNNDVVHQRLSEYTHALSRPVRGRFSGGHEVINPDAVEQEAMISDQAPVAPPPQCLAAHNHRTFSCRRLDKLPEGREEFS